MSESKEVQDKMPKAPDTDAPSKKYNASCHCGAFKYTVEASPPLDDPAGIVSTCTCSICVRNGYMHIYPPSSRVEFTAGKFEDFKAYSFASHRVAHYFCGTCGSSCMARSVDPGFFAGMTCVNVRMFEDVDFNALYYKEVDGKKYTPPEGEAK